MLFFLVLQIAVFHHALGTNQVTIPRYGLSYPTRCQTSTDIQEIDKMCAVFASAGLQSKSEDWTPASCRQEYCDSLTPKDARLLPDTMAECNDRKCVKYTLGFKIDCWNQDFLNPRIIRFVGSNAPNGSPAYILPWLAYKIVGTTSPKFGRSPLRIVEFYAPDYGNIQRVEILVDRQHVYTNLPNRGGWVDSAAKFIWLSKGHYNYWWKFTGVQPENIWAKPIIVTKEWKYNDLVDPMPVCYGRGLCPYLGKLGYSFEYPSYQERWHMAEINAARNSPVDYWKFLGRDPNKIKCGKDGSWPYYYDLRMGQGARFKSWEAAGKICDSGHDTCPQHKSWFCKDVNNCGWYERCDIFAKDPCLNGYCTDNSEMPNGRALSATSEGYRFMTKAEGIGGSPLSLVEADSGHCGGVLTNIRKRTSLGFYPNIDLANPTKWRTFSGAIVIDGPFSADLSWYPNNPLYNAYSPIPSAGHKVLSQNASVTVVRFMLTWYSTRNSVARHIMLYMSGGPWSMGRRIGNGTYGTYMVDIPFTKPPTGPNAPCLSYYFLVVDRDGKQHLMPESGIYKYMTYNVFGCRQNTILDACARAWCGFNGFCVNNGTCDCLKGYTGNKCQHRTGVADPCAGTDCGGFGTCSKSNGGKCVCTDGYFGPSCEIPPLGKYAAGDHGDVNNKYFLRAMPGAPVVSISHTTPTASGGTTSGGTNGATGSSGGSAEPSNAVDVGLIVALSVAGLFLAALIAVIVWVCRKRANEKDAVTIGAEDGYYSPPQAIVPAEEGERN